MKTFKLIFIYFIFTLSSSSQNLNEVEYDIYANVIGKEGYQFYPINFNIPNEYKFQINDSIYDEIGKIPNKEFDLKKMFAKSLKYSVGKTFKIQENNLKRQIYFSQIYFKNKDDAFFIIIVTDNNPKPLFLFLEAKKINNEWNFYDYYERY